MSSSKVGFQNLECTQLFLLPQCETCQALEIRCCTTNSSWSVLVLCIEHTYLKNIQMWIVKLRKHRRKNPDDWAGSSAIRKLAGYREYKNESAWILTIYKIKNTTVHMMHFDHDAHMIVRRQSRRSSRSPLSHSWILHSYCGSFYCSTRYYPSWVRNDVVLCCVLIALDHSSLCGNG